MAGEGGKRYLARFPAGNFMNVGQNEANFVLRENDKDLVIRFHDYDSIFQRPGLYEQLFYDRLQCVSPERVCSMLSTVLVNEGVNKHSLRALDLGAGNGMVGELLKAARVVGVDILASAREACDRDRPGVYDAYYVTDMANLDESTSKAMNEWKFNCMTCVAALGFGDIPTPAFIAAFNVVQIGGWIAINIKETFLETSDKSGFSSLIKSLMISDTLKVMHLERYRHRLSIDGAPLYYYGLVARKLGNINPESVLK